MAIINFIQILIIIQYPVICLSHAVHDVILSPNEFSGKYVKFNRLIEMTTKVPWEEPLKESVKIALSSPNISKDLIQKAHYVGIPKIEPSFGDIAIIAKGKLKKFANETFVFEEIHDVCEYQCQNNADKYLENVTALWMVERIRHRDSERGYRYDLKFTVVPIFNGRNTLTKSNNLEERLRNILKKTFILRDSDYPKYFKQITPKMSRRADINRSMSGYVTPNHLMHPAYGYAHPPKMHPLNVGEIVKKPAYIVPKPPALSNYYPSHVNNNNNRYPIRFPDSRENYSSLKTLPYRIKPSIKEDEEKQEAHIVNNIVDHRGAVDLDNKPFSINSPQKPLPARSTNLFVSQPAILLPQMPISLIQLAPYPIPMQLQMSTPSNQIIYTGQQQPDVTTFRYPTFFNTHQVIPQLQYPKNKTNSFKKSEVHVQKQIYSLPDPIYHSTSTSETPVSPTMYTPKLSSYVTASSVQVNSYDNNEFQPIIAPYLSHAVKNISQKEQDEKSLTKPQKYTNRYTTSRKAAATIATTTEHPKENHQHVDFNNYDIVVTRPSVIKSEKPILKWRHRNKTSNFTSHTVNALKQTSTESSSIHPTIKASTHSQNFRGRNRFINAKRNSSTPTLSFNQNLKQFKRKATTTLLPITTVHVTSTPIPTSVTTLQETKEAVTSSSYSTIDTTTASYELIPAGVEAISNNSSNIKIYRATAPIGTIDVYDSDEEKVKIDEIASTIIKHAKSVENDSKI